jgi:hypothetical protein
MRPDPFSLLALTFGASSYLRSNGCDSVATYFKFLFGAALRREFSVRLADTYLIREPVMSNAGSYSLIERQRRPAPEEQYSMPTMFAPSLPTIFAVSFVGVQPPYINMV